MHPNFEIVFRRFELPDTLVTTSNNVYAFCVVTDFNEPPKYKAMIKCQRLRRWKDSLELTNIRRNILMYPNLSIRKNVNFVI